MVLSLEDLVPQNHILRAIDQTIDFSFIYDLVRDINSDSVGRPSLDPVLLIKIPMSKSTLELKACAKPSEKSR